jgi:hypothetical protein
LEFSLAQTLLDLLLQLGLTIFIWLGFNFISLLPQSCINLMLQCTKVLICKAKKSPCLLHFCLARPPDPSFTRSSNSLLDFLPGRLPKYLPEIVPDSLPESYPSVFPRFLPEIELNSLLDSLSGTLPESVPESYPSVLPGALPESYPDTYPIGLTRAYPSTYPPR